MNCLFEDYCSTVVCTSVSDSSGSTKDSGTTKEEIIITCAGLSNVCQPEFYLGGAEGTTLELDDSKAKVRFDGVLPKPGMYEITSNVCNVGCAIIVEKHMYFSIYPHVDSISSVCGSTQGGQKITITGALFTEGTEVHIGSEPCEIEELKYGTIVCLTPAAPKSTKDIIVSVLSDAGKVKAECQLSSGDDCEYNYKDSCTPVVNSVSPKPITLGATVVTIEGNFLTTTDANDIKVKIGGADCENVEFVESSTSSITCDLKYGVHGENDVYVLVKGYGKADTAKAQASVR